MTAIAIQAGFPQFADTDGTPLNNGKIYIGEVNKDPVANPIPVFFDQAKTIPAAQPLDTSNGYLYYQGSPSAFYTGGGYSLKVINSSGVTVYEAPEGIVTTVSSTLEEITQYLGAFDSAPATRGDGTALQVGDIFFDTTVNLMKVYDGSSFIGFAGPYLPLTGGTIAGDVKFNDDEELRFGDSNDLRIYHDGSNSFIRELGTGNLKISADANVEIGSSVTSPAQVIVKGIGTNGTDFYFGSSLKASIKSTGLDVNGLVEFNTIKGGTGVTISTFLDEDDMASNSATALATQQSIKAYVDAAVGPGETLAQTLALGNTTGGNNINVTAGDFIDLPDGAQVRFGDDNDLKIYHDSSNSYVRDSGTGNLLLQGTNTKIQTASGEDYITCDANGAVKLYHNNASKLTTQNIGVDIEGRLTFDSLLGVSGAAVTRVLNEDNMSSDSDSALATQQSIKAYVDSQVGGSDTLAEILAVGSTTGGTNIQVSGNDDINFTDSSEARFGDSADLRVLHDGSNASLINTTGETRVDSAVFSVRKADGLENIIKGTADGSVQLYHDSLEVLETKVGGVVVTGDLQCDTITAGTFNPSSINTTQQNTMTVNSNIPPLILVSTDNDAASGPELEFYRNSAATEDGNVLGKVTFSANNSAGNKFDGLILSTTMSENANGNESVEYNLRAMHDGTLRSTIQFNDIPGADSELVINQDGQDINFRVESDTQTNALFVQGSDGFVGIGTNNPGYELHVNGDIYASNDIYADDLFLEDGAPTITLTDTTSGQVGTLQQSNDTLVLKSQATNSYGAFRINRGNSADTDKQALFLTNDSSMYLYNSSNQVRFVWDSTLGTSGGLKLGSAATPSEALDVAGNIVSSGNIGADTLSASGSSNLGDVFASGRVKATRTGNAPIISDRLNASGSLIALQLQGQSTADIGYNTTSELYLKTTGGGGLRINNAAVKPTLSGFNANDNACDLGASGSRFKDAYIAGGVYLGGTVAANKLDDYEEGDISGIELTDATNGASGGNLAAIGNLNAYYTKIGNMVHVIINLSNIDTTGMTGTQQLWMRGLPFPTLASSITTTRPYTVQVDTGGDSSLGVVLSAVGNSNVAQFRLGFESGSTSALNVSAINNSSSDIQLNFSYKTAA